MADETNQPTSKGKIPPWLLIGGGAVVLVLLLRGGSSSGSTSGGIQTAEISDQLAEQRQSLAAELAAQRTDFDDRLKLAEGETAKARAAAEAAALAAADKQNGQTDLLGQLLAAIQKLGSATPAAPAAPSTPTTPAAPLGPRPSDDAVREWARGIGLPEAWGFAFVGRYGILPRDIPELETWRAAIGVFNGRQWCLAGECI